MKNDYMVYSLISWTPRFKNHNDVSSNEPTDHGSSKLFGEFVFLLPNLGSAGLTYLFPDVYNLTRARESNKLHFKQTFYLVSFGLMPETSKWKKFHSSDRGTTLIILGDTLVDLEPERAL